MSVGSIMGTAVHQAARQPQGDVVSTKVLGKAMDAEVNAAAALLNTLPPPVQASSNGLPDHIGKNINVVA